MKNIVLASASPRRKELLKLLNLPFIIDVEEIEEVYDKNLNPAAITMHLSNIKAKPISEKHPDKIVIGADTIVVANQTILGKPKNKEEAFKMLTSLSGKTHTVITGVTIYYHHQFESFYSQARVTFFPLTPEEITQYIETNEPFDKAGAYGIQGEAAKFIHSIEGDYSTIVGLPIGQLYQHLKSYL